MASTVIRGPEWYQLPGLEKTMLEIIPYIVNRADSDAVSVTTKVGDIIEHELFKQCGFDTFEEYAAKILEKPLDWFLRVERVSGPIGRSLADERLQRNREIHAKREEGKTQQQIADEVGLSRQRVTQVLQVNPAIAEKTSKPKRVEICLKINAGTNPSVAAAKIREKFGDGFALALAEELVRSSGRIREI